MTPKFPIKFILLWILNLALLLALTLPTDILEKLPNIQNAAALYAVAGFLLAGLEQALWDKLRGND